MSVKKIKDLRNMDNPTLATELVDLQKELYNLRLRSVVEKVENPSRFKIVRRSIARVKTVLSEKSNKSITV